MIAAIEITEETPMTMPSTVKAERTFDERSVSMAAKKFSRVCASVMIAISQTSGPQPGPVVMRASRDRSRKTTRPWEGRIRPESQRDQESHRDARKPSGNALHETFRHELPQNVALCRAHGAPHADLPSPQRHAHQHDVHDDDAADDH